MCFVGFVCRPGDLLFLLETEQTERYNDEKNKQVSSLAAEGSGATALVVLPQRQAAAARNIFNN